MIKCAINEKYYEHGDNAWKTFKMKNKKNNHYFYLKVDDLFLADVFGTFRKESTNSFELDPVNYLSTPGYRWNAMLKVTGVILKTYLRY